MEQLNQIEYPGWETVRLLGRGSYGSVYEIRRNLFGSEEKAALKVISVPHDENAVEELLNAGYTMEGVTRHFQSQLGGIVREYQLMTGLRGSTNVVNCDDIRCEEKGDAFGWNVLIRMELLKPMLEALESINSEKQVVKLGRDIGNALRLCRRNNILHRDLKPQNIFVSADGDYKLGDFGIAKVSEKTSGGTRIGTYNYMAPEVYKNQPYGHQADLYSLGLVMYWLLNDCRLPFYPPAPAVPMAIDQENARKRRFRGDALPLPRNGSRELQSIVLKACAYDPGERYRDAEELLGDLEALRPSAEPFAPPEQKAEEESEERRGSTRDAEEEEARQQRGVRTLKRILALAVIALLAAVILLLNNYRKSLTAVPASASPPAEEDTEEVAEGDDEEEELVFDVDSPYLGVWKRDGLDDVFDEYLCIYSVKEDTISFVFYDYFYAKAVPSGTRVENVPFIDGVVDCPYEDYWGHYGTIHMQCMETKIIVDIVEDETSLQEIPRRGTIAASQSVYHQTEGVGLDYYSKACETVNLEFDVDIGPSDGGDYSAIPDTSVYKRANMTKPHESYDDQDFYGMFRFLTPYPFSSSYVEQLTLGSEVMLFGMPRRVLRIIPPGGVNNCSSDHPAYLLSNNECISWDELYQVWALYSVDDQNFVTNSNLRFYKFFDVDEWELFNGPMVIYDDYYAATHGERNDPASIRELYERYPLDFEDLVFILEVRDGQLVSVRLPDQTK